MGVWLAVGLVVGLALGSILRLMGLPRSTPLNKSDDLLLGGLSERHYGVEDEAELVAEGSDANADGPSLSSQTSP